MSGWGGDAEAATICNSGLTLQTENKDKNSFFFIFFLKANAVVDRQDSMGRLISRLQICVYMMHLKSSRMLEHLSFFSTLPLNLLMK